MDENLVNQVRRFVAEETGCALKQITLETTLLGDLDVDGDDADELFVAFSKRFHVDLTGIDLTPHFYDECSTGPMDLIRMAANLFRKESQASQGTEGKVPITIHDLVQAAERKRWLPG